MASHRFEIETSPGPSSRGNLAGTLKIMLVRVRLFDGNVDDATGLPAGEEDVYTDLAPGDARRLAIRLLQDADRAEQASRWPR